MAEKMTDEKLRALVDSGMDQAMGGQSGSIATERAKAWNYYLSKKLGNEVDGQSQVVSSDVSDVVDGIMPSLLRIFTTADNAVSFDAVGPEDEDAAAQESDTVNHVFFKQNPSLWIMFCWFFDALVQKNGVVEAWPEIKKEISQDSYEGLTDDELTMLLSDDELELVSDEERAGETVIASATGQVPAPATVHDVVVRRVTKRKRIRVEPIPPEEYRISADARSLDPADGRLVGRERLMTRSELLEIGFDRKLVASLPAADDSVTSTQESAARLDKTDDSDDAPRDKSQEEILVRKVFIRVDFDGDGLSELREVWTAGGKLLSNEVADRQSFHVLSPHPLPHKHFGRATAEKVMDIQEVNTTLLRQVLDNLYHTNNPSHGVWEQAMGEFTLDDLLTTRVGSIKRFARPVNEAYQQLTVPFTAGATFPMLEWWEKVKRDRTGIHSDGEGLSPESLKNIQIGVLSSAIDISKMKVEMIARLFAETGIRSLFQHIHELLQKHQDKPMVLKLRNEWVTVDPQEWRKRENMSVQIGLGIGTREQNLLHLDAIWQKQSEIAQNGGLGTLVSPRNLFNTASEIVKNANLKDPALFFTDPGTAPAAPPPGQQDQLIRLQTELAQRQQELDQARQKIDALKAQAQDERERMKLELQREKQADDFTVAMEGIRTKLTELELKYATNVPGAAV